ncbi:hypothetical protein ABIB68_008135 [Bradyrhizobium sp. F1.2.2]
MKSSSLRMMFHIAFFASFPACTVDTYDELLDDRFSYGVTGQNEAQLPKKLGPPLEPRRLSLAGWYSSIKGSAYVRPIQSGCRSPTHGFGDTQALAICSACQSS